MKEHLPSKNSLPLMLAALLLLFGITTNISALARPLPPDGATVKHSAIAALFSSNAAIEVPPKNFSTSEMPPITVTGRVTSSTGEGIAGVSVSVKGAASQGTSTDPSGNFSINVSDTATLVFSSVGFESQEVEVKGQTTVNVVLSGVSAALEQVVVIGYGAANRRDLTGTIATVKGRDVADRPSANPIASIQGKVAGVYIVNNGRPGAQPDIRIRGTNSINSVGPLYVVDGILNDNISYINPGDIESMEVLKDPSSLAIFGVRGANGVVIITTKRAKAGQVMVNFSSSIGIKQVVDKIKLTDAAGFKTLYNEQLQNQATDAGRPAIPYDYTKWQGNTDWQDQIFQNAILNYNNINITGATDKNRFYMGLGYITEEGVIKTERLQKMTLNINDEYRVSKALKFGFNFNAYRAQLPQERSVGGAILAAPIAEPYNAQYGLYSSLPDFQRAQVGNPLTDIELRKNTQINTEYRAVGSITGELDFLRKFNFKATLFADYGFNTGRGYNPIIAVYNPDIVNATPIDTLSRVTSVNQFHNLYTKVQQDYLLTYKNTWGDHNLTVLGGVTSYYSSYEAVNSARTQGSGFAIPNNKRFWYTEIGDAATQTGGGSAWEAATLSYLARALYSYQGRYLLNASFRRDGTSAFPKDGGRFQNFGSVGAAWVLTKENFMSNQNWANDLKLKASWGILGNQNTGNQYPFYPLLTSANSGVFGNNVVQALAPSYLPDSNLHWETVNSYEVGVELNTLGNKLHFEANWYHKLTNGILVTIPGIAGTTPGVGNVGQVENYGIELSATYNHRVNDDLNFSFSGNFTTLHNEVKSLSTTGYEIIEGPSRTKTNYPLGFFYGYASNGIYQTATEISKSPASQIGDVKPGDIKFKDINGDGVITADDRTMIGNPTPDFTYGASFNAGYKGFDFNVDVMGVYGNEIFRNWNRGTFAQFNFPEYRQDRWNGAGSSNWEPILSTGRSNNYLISNYYIEDGSFFRLRNLQIGYNFNSVALARVHLKGLRFYANAQNLATLKNSTGYSPEFGGSATSFGIDNGSYPVPAIYTFGLNLNF